MTKKRVGLIINSLSGGGAERVVCTLANHWTASGTADVFILCLSGENTAFELNGGVQVESIWKGKEKTGLGAAVRSREAGRAVREWRGRNNVDSCLSFLQRANFANVLSWAGKTREDGKIIISQRNVATHDYPARTLNGRIARYLIRRFYNRASSIICNSSGVVESLSAIGVERELCRVVGNPQEINEINRAGAASPSRLWRTNGKLRLIAVGRLIPQKGFDVLLPALGRLAHETDFECLILGRGPLQRTLERQREALGLTQHVTFFGWDDNPFAAIHDADVFLLPSRWEGFGNVLLEAMALGRPIVAADCPGSPRWLLEDGKFGMLFENENSESLYQALEPLALDAEMRADYGRRAARRAEDFSVEAMAQEYWEILFPEEAENQPAGDPKNQQCAL